jgi:outer membrane lipopolysaccharide assembly protein LptE/RlpB
VTEIIDDRRLFSMRLIPMLLIIAFVLAGCGYHHPNIVTVPGGTPGSSCASSDRSACIGY